MYKFIVLATIVAVACALPTPKPDAKASGQYHPVVYSHVGQHLAYVVGQPQTYVVGQPQAYISGHNQIYVGAPQEYYGATHGHHGGHQKSYEVNSGYASPYYVSGYVPLYNSHHTSPVVYKY